MDGRDEARALASEAPDDAGEHDVARRFGAEVRRRSDRHGAFPPFASLGAVGGYGVGSGGSEEHSDVQEGANWRLPRRPGVLDALSVLALVIVILAVAIGMVLVFALVGLT